MVTLYPKLIIEALEHVKYPGNGKSVVANEMIEDDIRIEGAKVSFTMIFERPTDPFIKSVVRSAETALRTYISPEVDIVGNISVKYRKPMAEKPATLLPGVKNIIGVSSGKGGVGKSTIAANLAVGLAARGYRVGLLDADIFGPSMPKMFGVEDQQLYMVNKDGRDWIEPVERYGVKMLSIGFVVDKEKPVLWRGGMASNALKQLISDAWWGELDYFIIDMPPGTSDIHLTLVQTLAITGIVVVSTPQEVALADARKGIAMFTDPKVNVPILGLVENMAWFTPAQHPDERYYIFGEGGGVRLAETTGIRLLAQIPLVMDIRAHADDGAPVALQLAQDPEGADPQAKAFDRLAVSVIGAVAERNRLQPPTQRVDVSKR
ncbi:MAG: Mrp/NBP35 family ATP-binding protein [Muribaculaceae bacterium]|nr:Mrp/NBP35 family ATP-binding protein [Bacteroidales bacterium]MDD6701196.1 Mrp/NBP35 family ATP-binding protein [Bacteroidales bacterium]MDD6943599.1 Mrp/NBP35 family ATP-binding protein [Bacteroidales bacterium]MDY2733418.1 Mrp/NBP35 family ATP-binding protein [Muribaculaceae bacterium]